MAKATVWVLREPDGWLSVFDSKKELKESLADWAQTNETTGMSVAEYSLNENLKVKDLLPKEKK